MKLLMISGDRSLAEGRKGAFWYMLEEFSKQWERIDVITPKSRIPGTKSPARTQFSAGGQKNSPFFENIFVHQSPWSVFWQSKWIFQKGCELYEEHHHDVMTVHEYPPFFQGVGAERLSKATGLPYALEIHHIVGYPVAASLTEWMGRVLSRRYLSHDARPAAAVRTVNNGTKEVLMGWGVPEEKISVVPSFYLDHALFADRSPAQKTYDLCFCGRLVVNKGVMEMLEAVKDLPQATLLIIGDGPLRETADMFIRSHHMERRVKMAGWLDSMTDVLSAMRTCRVFVMNSKSEGGPRVALEAMASGLPVIATRVGVMPEVIRDRENGMFADGSARDLAQKIRLLLDDQEGRDRMGNEAKKILDHFERKKLIGEYAKFLQNIAA